MIGTAETLLRVIYRRVRRLCPHAKIELRKAFTRYGDRRLAVYHYDGHGEVAYCIAVYDALDLWVAVSRYRDPVGMMHIEFTDPQLLDKVSQWIKDANQYHQPRKRCTGRPR
jgi:hypothetical protein